jgi:hypothetical protein
MYLEEKIIYMNSKLELLKGKQNIIVWGAAESTVRMFQYTAILQYNVTDFVDHGKVGEVFFGKTIKSPKDIVWDRVDAVVISAFYHESSIESELQTNFGFDGVIIKFNEAGQEIPFYQYPAWRDIKASEDVRAILEKNCVFKDIHKNKRLFILCCGPSIQKMDLTVLKDEITMAVHSFYLHKDIGIIQPDYYCSAQWSYPDEMKESLGLKYVKEIKKFMGSSKYFFSVRDQEMIEKSEVFGKDEVYYYDYGIDGLLYQEFDFCQRILPIQSVPILCLQLALYMGFQEIYLLGTEHDAIVTGKYSHFYQYSDSITSKENGETDAQGNLHSTFSIQLKCICRLWEQYEILKKIAEKKGSKIYNATPGGVLDVFERVDFNALWND